MKNRIKNFINKNKKYLIILFIGCLLMLFGYISWDVYFSKIEIFKNEEKKMQQAAERYYSFRKQYLPKEGGYKTITLEQLYENVEMDYLYIPKTKKSCDLNSWVRVYNKNNEYKYITYLECGKYKSKVDHEEPKIKLNGNQTFYVALGSKYEELGVKEVVDDTDGKIDTKNVVIDSSNVDTSKIGEYEVTYTVYDSTYNEAVLKRKIVVSKKLSDTVKQNTDETNYYKGNSNNYVLFSGMLWRIIRANENGTVKIMLAQPSSNLRINYDKYENGNVDTWLNEYFYSSLTNPDKYVVDSDFCVGNINATNDYSNYCSEKVTRKVGLLDINEYYMINTGVNTSTYTLANNIGNNINIAPINSNNPYGIANDILAPISPTLVLNNDLSIISGDGSEKKPYKLNDYDYAAKGDELNSRIVGEYFIYSGMPFRIIRTNDDDSITAISAGNWTIQPNNSKLSVSTVNLTDAVFDINEESTPAYAINNDFLDYIDTKSLLTTNYSIPTNLKDKKYNELKERKIKAKVLFPKTYELFSSSNSAIYGYLYIDSSEDSKNLFMLNTSNNYVYEAATNLFDTYNIKIVITVKGNLRIESGKGIINDPYKVK